MAKWHYSSFSLWVLCGFLHRAKVCRNRCKIRLLRDAPLVRTCAPRAGRAFMVERSDQGKGTPTNDSWCPYNMCAIRTLAAAARGPLLASSGRAHPPRTRGRKHAGKCAPPPLPTRSERSGAAVLLERGPTDAPARRRRQVPFVGRHPAQLELHQPQPAHGAWLHQHLAPRLLGVRHRRARTIAATVAPAPSPPPRACRARAPSRLSDRLCGRLVQCAAGTPICGARGSPLTFGF